MRRTIDLLVVLGLQIPACGPSTQPPATDPKGWRTELPGDIETHLADYVNMEFEGTPNLPTPIGATDFTYRGEFVVDGVPTRYWSYPCGTAATCWVIVEPWEDSYVVSPGEAPPRSGEQRP